MASDIGGETSPWCPMGVHGQPGAIATVLTGIEVMAHICAKNLRTYTLSRSTARATRNKVQVSYIEIIGIEFVTIWARWLTGLRVWCRIRHHLKRGRVPMYLATPISEIPHDYRISILSAALHEYTQRMAEPSGISRRVTRSFSDASQNGPSPRGRVR